MTTITATTRPTAVTGNPRLSLFSNQPGAGSHHLRRTGRRGKRVVGGECLFRYFSDNRLKTDPIHSNGAGYQKLADGIAEALIKFGLLAKP